MAEIFVLLNTSAADPTWVVGSGPRYDGYARLVATDPQGRHPRHVLWSFIPASEGASDGWGMIVDHRHSKLLLADNGEVRHGDPVFRETALWKIVTHGDIVEVVPKTVSNGRLARGALLGDPMTIIAGDLSDPVIRWQSAWYLRPQPAAPDVPRPNFDDADTFYNVEAVTLGGDATQVDHLYLMTGDERAPETPVRFGRDVKSTRTHFRIVPSEPGRVVSAGKVFATDWTQETPEHLAAIENPRNPLALLNLSGARHFVSGDLVALRTSRWRYVSWKPNAKELAITAWTPRKNETFTIVKVGGTGEIKPGDSFALLAGNGRYITHDRGSAGNEISAASEGHIAAWETFTLGAPLAQPRYNLVSRGTGRPLALHRDHPPVASLVHRYARYAAEPADFEICDWRDGLFSLRWERANLVSLGSTGVQEGEPLGTGERTMGPGTFFRFAKAPAAAWPDTPDLMLESYRDPVEDFARGVAGAMVTLVGTVSGIPGGGAIFTAVFDRLFPAKKVSSYDLFSRFRDDILRDVKNLIATNAVFQSQGALRSAHEQYLVTYLNLRRAAMDGGEALTSAKTAATTLAQTFATVLAFLSVERNADNTIRDTEQNVATIRAGLPVYATCVAEYINALQEVALLYAYQPSLALPDVWLKTRDQYVTATPDGGVKYTSTDKPLPVALRLLSRNGSATLRHGAKVILRTPLSTHVTAVSSGGGPLEAKTPLTQIGATEVFTIEKVTNPAPQPAEEIHSGDSIALRAPDGTHYVTAPDGGGPLTASATQRGASETFVLTIAARTLLAEEPGEEDAPAAGENAGPAYEPYIQNLRTFAALRYNDVRDYYNFLLNDRIAGKHIYHDQEHWTISYSRAGEKIYEDRYSLSFRDKVYNIELDRVAPDDQHKPPGWDDPDNYEDLQNAMDQYRHHIATTFHYYKYRYFDAVRPLLTIADETQKLCEQMWTDPLAATEYSYAARITPVYTG